MASRDSFERLVDDYRHARVSRREVMKRATALGISLPAIAGMLAVASPVAAQSTPAAGAGTPGGTLREGYDLDFSRMDPINTSWYDPGFYRPLRARDHARPRRQVRAADRREVGGLGDDGKHLDAARSAPGCKFHSGARSMPPRSRPSTTRSRTRSRPVAAGLALRPGREQSVAPDADRRSCSTLKHPYADIFNVISTGYWAIVNMADPRASSADRVRQAEYRRHPARSPSSSGCRAAMSTSSAGTITRARSSPYFENKGKAYLDGIHWTTILEAAARDSQIENSEIDTVHAPAFQDVARLKSNGNLNLTRLKEWSGYILGLNFDRTQFDFQDVKMRQAVSHGASTGRRSSMRSLFGEGEPLYGPITVGRSLLHDGCRAVQPVRPGEVKSLVARLGWMAGSATARSRRTARSSTSSFVVQAESFNQQIGQVIQDQLKQSA